MCGDCGTELIKVLPKLIEPFYGVRKGLFGLDGPAEPGEQFALSLLSPLRVFGDGSVALLKQGPDYVLQWPVIEAKQGSSRLPARTQLRPSRRRICRV